MKEMIPFNKPFLTGKEIIYIEEAVASGKISGNGLFTNRCQQYFVSKYGFKKALLTSSCTDALEMTALLSNIKQGDEVIIPSYTFVSTALAFIRQGANIIFADSENNNPNIDTDKIEALISKKTKAIVPVHYAGIACNMDKIMDLAAKYNLIVIEDAAQSIDSYYKGKPLGSIGDFGCFSFHETKNIISGEGGMITINEEQYLKRSEIIWEKGTNRAEFFRGEVNKYGWVDVGSSFLPSEIVAAFLFAQIENLDIIQNKRKSIWSLYFEKLSILVEKGFIELPFIPEYATNNAHMFYIVCRNFNERTKLIEHLKKQNIMAVFHYLSLHKSEFYNSKYKGEELLNCDRFADTLLRLPLFYNLTLEQVNQIIEAIYSFYVGNSN
jgi:dTDP-4-amino-4,6-dideoxygalactose transaminase